MANPPCAIFDLNGTLMDMASLRHLVVGVPVEEKDYEAFHGRSLECPPHGHVVEAAQKAHAEGIAVIVASACRSKWMPLTECWLKAYGIRTAGLLMREDSDMRSDVEVKRGMLEEIRRHWTPVHAWEDNPNAIAFYESEGISCTRVPGWGTPPVQPSAASIAAGKALVAEKFPQHVREA